MDFFITLDSQLLKFILLILLNNIGWCDIIRLQFFFIASSMTSSVQSRVIRQPLISELMSPIINPELSYDS